jgi:hypothetical protein
MDAYPYLAMETNRMAKNSPEGNRRRMAAQRERDQAAGVASVTVKAPSSAKPALHRVAKLLREGTETRAAFRMVGGSNEPEPTSDVWRVQAELLKDERDRLRGDLDQANRERSQLTGMLGGLQEQIGQTMARLEAQAANIATLEPMADLGKAMTSYPGWRGRLVRWIIRPKR